LGECEVKHGHRLSVVNFYTDDAGNPNTPAKFTTSSVAGSPRAMAQLRQSRKRPVLITAVLLFAVILAASFWMFRGSRVKTAVEKSIAVLPFENLSDEKQNAYFADGVQDEILTNLAKVADLKVISRTSVMPYKSGVQRNLREIAHQLGVSHLL